MQVFQAAVNDVRFLCHVSTSEKQKTVERPCGDRKNIVRSPQPALYILKLKSFATLTKMLFPSF